MGATFANVHVHAGDDPEEALERVCDAVENVCAEEGFGPPAAGQNPDRSIVLMRGSEWISVYDEGALYSGFELSAFAANLSKAAFAHVVTAQVFDSDTVTLALFNAGKRVDHFLHTVLDEVEGGRKKAISARRWLPVLTSDCGVADMTAALQPMDRFLERMLVRVARPLGLDESAISMDFRDAERARGSARVAAGKLLRFRRLDPVDLGPPVLAWGGYSPRAEMWPERPIHLTADCFNCMGAGCGQGIEVVVTGKGIEQEVVCPTTLNVERPRRGRPYQPEEAVSTSFRQEQHEGQRQFVARLADYPIRAGGTKQSAMTAIFGYDPADPSVIRVHVEATVLAYRETSLVMSIRCTDRPEHVVRLEYQTEPRR